MKTLTKHLKTANLSWKEIFPGVQMSILQGDFQGMKGTCLIRIAAGCKFPKHQHHSWEQIFVLAGQMQIAETQLTTGDFFLTEARTTHELYSDKGCMFMTICPEGIQIVPSHEQDEYDEVLDASAELGDTNPIGLAQSHSIHSEEMDHRTVELEPSSDEKDLLE